jgi:ATP-binding cassette subfamily F protein 3
MLLLRNLTVSRGPNTLFTGASLTIERGWKVGLVGANGSGKSSLLALLAGELSADTGDCEITPGTRLARISQEAPALERAVVDYLLDADPPLRAAEREIADAERSGDGARLALAHEHFQHADGYTARPRALTLLAGLGYAQGDAERAVKEFSGGYRMRLNLARALMAPSDLLLLDEPTNHLDLDTILWLENWLRAYAGTFLVVSHDRDFLDRVCERTLALSASVLRLYGGNYSWYEQQRALEIEQQLSAAARQEKEVERISTFVARFRASATKARQVQSRVKALERMAKVAPVYAAETFQFQFEEPVRRPERIVSLEAISAGYGERPVIADVSLTLSSADRVAVIGVNGAGKTTLVRLLAGEIAPLTGRRSEGREIVIGYFAQHQVEMLDPTDTPLGMLARLYRGEREQALRDFLGRFGFSGDRAGMQIGPLSGGEKSRLALAALVKRRPNLLLLDEPTNHLDLEMRRSLSLALQGFEGALVIVSHDRNLIANCADHILVVADGRVQDFEGDLDDYRRLRMQEDRAVRGAPERQSRKDERRAGAEARAQARSQLRPLEKEVARIDARIAKLTKELDTARAALADPALYADDANRTRVAELQVAEARLATALSTAEEDWLHASARLEAARLEAAEPAS